MLFHEDQFHDFQLPVSYHQFKDVDDHIDHEDEMHTDIRVEPAIPVEIENREHTPAVGVTQPETPTADFITKFHSLSSLDAIVQSRNRLARQSK